MKLQRIKSLSDFSLFEDLEANALSELEKLAQPRLAPKGRLLYLPGDESEAVFFLAAGRVKISRLSDHGKEFILEIVEPGTCFGEAGVLDVDVRDAAPVPGILLGDDGRRAALAVPAKAFRSALVHTPGLLMKLTQLMGRRQQQLEKRLMDVVYKNAPQRLADLLLQLSQNYGVRDSRGILLRIKLSQSALGNLLGVSREIVNHTFSGLRRRGVIDVTEGRVIIQNPQALAELAA